MEPPLQGALRDELVGAMRRVPELADGELTLTALSGGITNPNIDTFFKPFGNVIAGMPAWPVFETFVITLVIVGAVYYAISVRGREADREADVATGEAVIA